MKYLIVECDELGDQYECDANRIPITMTDDWKKWYEETKPYYSFEVYEFKDNEFALVKDYETPMEQGMAFVMYENYDDVECAFIERFPNVDRYKPMPKDLYERALEDECFDDSLRTCGYLSWSEGNKFYAYTEYFDNHINPPY
jgi:hypothetical protein